MKIVIQLPKNFVEKIIKIILTMKLSILLLVVPCQRTADYNFNGPISLPLKNTTLVFVLKDIRNPTSYLQVLEEHTKDNLRITILLSTCL
jgi:hypothetical protein